MELEILLVSDKIQALCRHWTKMFHKQTLQNWTKMTFEKTRQKVTEPLFVFVVTTLYIGYMNFKLLLSFWAAICVFHLNFVEVSV